MKGVYKQWNELLDWNTGTDYWISRNGIFYTFLIGLFDFDWPSGGLQPHNKMEK